LTKNGEPHTVPITPVIRRVLDTLPKPGIFALTGNGKGLGGHTKARAAIVMPDLDHWTYHDLRRSFANQLAGKSAASRLPLISMQMLAGSDHTIK
jgi:integrase